MSELYCEASINYLSTEGPVPVPVKIYDARREAELSWQTNGFELQVLPSRVENWADRAQTDAVHYDEVSRWARRESGCEKVLFFPGLLRNPAAEAESPDFAPIQAAHSDYTESYGDMIADPDHPYHRVLAPSMARAGVSAADLQSVSRVLTLQLWRNVGPALMDYPLAFCDARTVPRAQLFPLRVETYGGVETQFDAFGLLRTMGGDANRWYTFPQMQPDEVVVFRAFDSECVTTGAPFWTPHCAFRDPHSAGVARSSIEMRAICLFW